MPSGRWCVTWRTKNWKTGESNPSTSLHRSRDQLRPVGLRWAGGWQKNRAPREAQGRQVKNCRSHVDRQRRHRPVLVGGVHRCGTWPASASATASAASLDAAPGQHRYRHRQEPSTRRMPWHGRRWRRHRRLPSMWHMASIGIGSCIGGVPRCGTWPASVSSSSGALDADHALAWPVLASASTTSTRRWAVGVGRGETARCCVRSATIASRRREAVRAHLGSVDAAKSLRREMLRH